MFGPPSIWQQTIHGGQKSKPAFAINLICLLPANFWHTYAIGNLQPEDIQLAHLTWFV